MIWCFDGAPTPPAADGLGPQASTRDRSESLRQQPLDIFAPRKAMFNPSAQRRPRTEASADAIRMLLQQMDIAPMRRGRVRTPCCHAPSIRIGQRQLCIGLPTESLLEGLQPAHLLARRGNSVISPHGSTKRRHNVAGARAVVAAVRQRSAAATASSICSPKRALTLRTV